MYLFERVEEIARYSIAEAVLQDEQAATVVCAGLDTGNAGVAAHESTVGSTATILETMEKDTLMWTPHADDTVVLIDGVIGIGRGIGDVAWHIIDKVLWGIFYRDILRIAVHVTYKVVYYLAVVV